MTAPGSLADDRGDEIATFDVSRRCSASPTSPSRGSAPAREEIDALNVYPVPDGDTGTNMYLTFEAARDAMAERLAGADPDGDLRLAMAPYARGALLGARGNSGVILSQLIGALIRRIGQAGPDDRTAAVFAAGAAGGHRGRATPPSASRSRARSSRSRPRRPRRAAKAAADPDDRLDNVIRARGRRGGRGPRPYAGAAARSCVTRASSTPAAAGSASCSTPSSRRSRQAAGAARRPPSAAARSRSPLADR